jgi:hypothetical protein
MASRNGKLAMEALILVGDRARMHDEPLVNAVLESTEFRLILGAASIELDNACTLVEVGLPFLLTPFYWPIPQQAENRWFVLGNGREKVVRRFSRCPKY